LAIEEEKNQPYRIFRSQMEMQPRIGLPEVGGKLVESWAEKAQ